MREARGRIGLQMIVRTMRVALVLLIATTAAAQLNPTVRLLPNPSAPVPDECEDGRAPQPAPRVQVAEIPVERDTTRDMQPPPSRDLRAQLRAAQAAAESNNRDAFKEALAGIKSTLANYPPGGERDAASDAIGVYNDLERLWDHLFESPTGSFFDDSSPLHAAMRKYRGYEDAVRRQIITDASGTKFYPTRETRDFLVREAAQRLSRLGLAAPPPRVQPPPPAPAARPVTTTTTVKKAPRSSGGQAPSPVRRKAARTAPRSQARPPSPQPPAPDRAAPIDVPPPRPVVVTEAPPPAPPDTATAITTTTATDSDVVPAAEAPDTATTTTTAAPPAAQGKGRNIILPVMLILIGVGVLIVLFRTSA